MVSAELKENGKRVRHCFPRKEVYHRWIHADTYVYSNKSYIVSGKYDWLFAFTLNKNADKDIITYRWESDYDCNAHKCIAVINRDIKAILVNISFFKRSNELLSSIPDDYQVFLTEETIVNPYILSTGELSEVIKVHAKYLTKQFVEQQLTEFYSIIENHKIVAHKNVNDVFKYKNNKLSYFERYSFVGYDTVYKFVEKYNVKKYNWYNTPLYETLDLRDVIDWSKYNYIKINCPSVKAIITNKVFNKKEKLKLEQSHFYGLYCRGYGISRKELEIRWNDDYNKDELKALCDKHNININLDNRPELIKWKDGIKLYAKSVEANTRKILDSNINKSNENYNNAIKEYNDKHYEEVLNNWRNFCNFRHYNNDYIEYDKFVVSNFKYCVGNWIKDKVYPMIKFNNIQLRCRKNKINSEYNIIETSNNASVTLNQAIMMYKLYKNTIVNDCPIVGNIIKHDFTNKHIKVGLYNLRYIEFRQKQTDYGKLLNKWEYVVVIGCHHIWIDDFMSFIKYYNLEDKFGIN